MKNIILIAVSLLSFTCFSQSKTLLDTIMENHITEFRKTVGTSSPIFITFDYDFEKNLKMSPTDYYLTPYINPRKLKSDKNYLVKFIVSTEKNKLTLNAINFRLKKISNKKLEYINMGGEKYDLTTGLLEESNP
ncbi:hypothetical protein CHU92_00590 [Flavobacterium cyanobacteriorum]|uniref:Uncharacterized protein n=1 Tax=Flavobacterium cyanobacteriorum TaxID=2022802 RepID=A0A256A484_9FLAO|nr:hypothetical protein [Flavobacterium cyanobacteriorum]OYQ48667.1 hypothetical protein CHU92_00590 [Flavobacterium cyanobacteriorum]